MPFVSSFQVMSRSYRAPRHEIGASIRLLLDTDDVVIDRSAVVAGLALLDAGGDFADGVIAFECGWLGGDTFVSFDRRAVKLVQGMGCTAHLLA